MAIRTSRVSRISRADNGTDEFQTITWRVAIFLEGFSTSWYLLSKHAELGDAANAALDLGSACGIKVRIYALKDGRPFPENCALAPLDDPGSIKFTPENCIPITPRAILEIEFRRIQTSAQKPR